MTAPVHCLGRAPGPAAGRGGEGRAQQTETIRRKETVFTQG